MEQIAVSTDGYLTPDADSGELLIEVRGDLAGILAISLERKKPSGGEGCAQFEMVAGACLANCFKMFQVAIAPHTTKAA